MPNHRNLYILLATSTSKTGKLQLTPFPCHAAENGIFGSDIVIVNPAQFWFHQLRPGNSDVKDYPQCGRAIVENIDKIMEIPGSHHHASTASIAQELNTAQKQFQTPGKSLDAQKSSMYGCHISLPENSSWIEL